MVLLTPEKDFHSLIISMQPVYTKIKNEVPTYFSENSKVENCQLGSGCIINGRVKNSLISRGVKIQDDALIEESLIFTNSEIKSGAQVKFAIIDKGVV
ncbi:Glycogen biosynthesis protein GlgD [Lactococcus cremoris]|nr:Glycogen biosynthesis protein GlgD [Lactococcus cremoris]